MGKLRTVLTLGRCGHSSQADRCDEPTTLPASAKEQQLSTRSDVAAGLLPAYTCSTPVDEDKGVTRISPVSLPSHVLSYISKCHATPEKAEAAAIIYDVFRKTHLKGAGILTDSVQLDQVQNEEMTKKLEIFSANATDGKQIHVVFLEIKRHIRGSGTNMHIKIAHLIHYFEDIVQRLEQHGGEFQLVIDASGISLKNVDLPIFHQVATLQKVFRDLINDIYVVNAGMVFSKAFQILKPFLSPRIVNKVHFCRGADVKKLYSELGIDILRSCEHMTILWDKGAALWYKQEGKELSSRSSRSKVVSSP